MEDEEEDFHVTTPKDPGVFTTEGSDAAADEALRRGRPRSARIASEGGSGCVVRLKTGEERLKRDAPLLKRPKPTRPEAPWI